MKKSLFYAVYLVCIVFICNSCKKNTDAPKAISFKLDGVEKNATPNIGELDTAYKMQLKIGGLVIGNEGIFLQIANAKTGVFVIGKDDMLLTYNLTSAGQDFYFGMAGQVTITSLSSTKATGTFQFTGKDLDNTGRPDKMITEGTFDCTIERK